MGVVAKPQKQAVRVVSLPGSLQLWGLLLQLPCFLCMLNLLKNGQAMQAKAQVHVAMSTKLSSPRDEKVSLL